MDLVVERMPSPVGTIQLVYDDAALRALDFLDYDDRLHRLLRTHYGDYTLVAAERRGPYRDALEAYFAGDLAAIDAIRVETGGTPFQREVWRALRDIPAGRTLSYGALARQIGRPAAMRAVGLANGANPVGIVVPCHRVIGANGSLTGYGGGLPRKQWLLEHERRVAEPSLFKGEPLVSSASV